jgi:CubicO group peptidase (beta-lactamase class C family)
MRRPVLISAAVGLVVAVLAFLIAPGPHRLGSAGTGDAALTDRVRTTLDGDTAGYRGLSVAVVDRGQASTALLGDAPGGSLFEIGSITKAMTGMLFADLVADGVVRADETLASALPSVRFADPATASITLEELASHRSGLPRLAPGFVSLVKSQSAVIRGGNPYAGQDVDALLASAAEASPGDGRGQVNYSNFGMALLGQALAAKAGKPYDQLVTERLLRPLGMSETLIQVPQPTGMASASPGLVRISATIILLVWAAGGLLLLALTPIGRDKTWWRSNPDRLRFVTTALSAVAVLLLGHLIGAWLQVPPVLWALAAGLAAAGAAVLLLRWREMPAIADGGPRARWSQAVISAAVSVLVIAALAG